MTDHAAEAARSAAAILAPDLARTCRSRRGPLDGRLDAVLAALGIASG